MPACQEMKHPVGQSKAVSAQFRPSATLAFIVACLILFARRPDAVLHARFFAEDGVTFYGMAYNYGWWRVLFTPHGSYIHLFPRLVASLALLFPLGIAPLVQNLFAIIAEAIPVVLLLSPVTANWGSLRFRGALSILYLTVPNCGEILCSITESQWILALCALLILLGAAPQSRFGRIATAVFIAVCALTGPFSIFLCPIAAWMFWRQRTRWRGTLFFLILTGALTQFVCYLMHAGDRPHGPRAFQLETLLHLIGSQIFAGALIGGSALATHTTAIYVAIAGGILLILVLAKSSREMRFLAVFAAVVLISSLANPVIHIVPGKTELEVMASAPDMHYWFFPCLAVTWLLAESIRSTSKVLPRIGIALIPLLAFGIVTDFRQPALEVPQFPAEARAFEIAAPGTKVSISSAPEGWRAVLIKR